jgi:hypothetical protein
VSSRDAAGNLLIKGDSIKWGAESPPLASVGEIDIIGLDGNDNISVDEANGCHRCICSATATMCWMATPGTTRLFDS